jgi:murein DD-endopeptidase MepM/ murein hydrolase activator NlpD
MMIIKQIMDNFRSSLLEASKPKTEEHSYGVRYQKANNYVAYKAMSVASANAQNLLSGMSNSNQTTNNPSGQRGRFPLDESVNSYLKYPGRFSDPRDGGIRMHGGTDLYAPVGTNVFAVKDGTVIQNPYAFNTKFDFALEINHSDFIGRYCEINVLSGIRAGSIITQGQLIGTVAKMPGYKQTMLHFEMYSGDATGPLTDRANLPYMRRSDLIDPTHFLNFGY